MEDRRNKMIKPDQSVKVGLDNKVCIQVKSSQNMNKGNRNKKR